MRSSLINVNSLRNLKKDVLNAISKETKVNGVEKIKNELAKRNIDATVTCTQHGNKFTYSVEPKTQEISSEKLKPKEAAKIKSLLGPIPLEMFNQEVSKNSIPEGIINKTIEKIHEDVSKSVDEVIKKIL
jgi:hypothetical protein